MELSGSGSFIVHGGSQDFLQQRYPAEDKVCRCEAQRKADHAEKQPLDDRVQPDWAEQDGDGDDYHWMEHVDGERVVGERLDQLVLVVELLPEDGYQPDAHGYGHKGFPQRVSRALPGHPTVDGGSVSELGGRYHQHEPDEEAQDDAADQPPLSTPIADLGEEVVPVGQDAHDEEDGVRGEEAELHVQD